MKSNEAIRKIMKETKFTQSQIAIAIGKPGGNAVGSLLCTENLSANTMVDILNVMGYELVMQPKTQGQRKEGSIVIEKGEKKK